MSELMEAFQAALAEDRVPELLSSDHPRHNRVCAAASPDSQGQERDLFEHVFKQPNTVLDWSCNVTTLFFTEDL